MRKIILSFLILTILFLTVGYAEISHNFSISSQIEVAETSYDIYILEANTISGSNVEVSFYTATVLSLNVKGTGNTTFQITVVNNTSKDYVFDRVINGAELELEGVYSGNKITYSLTNLTQLQLLAAGGAVTFNFTINASEITENFIVKFNFVEKTGTEILPGGDGENTEPEQLPAPIVSIDETGIASWVMVLNATKYKYKINGGIELYTTDLQIQLNNGDTIEVKAMGDNEKYLDSNYSVPKTYIKVEEPEPEPELIELVTPVVKIDNFGVASWNLVENAIAYIYKINNKEEISISSNSVQLSDGDTIVVKAAGDGITYKDSPYSMSIKYTKPEEPQFHSDFLGLVEVLLSNQEKCLNSSSDIIYGAVKSTINDSKRPEDQAPAVHCNVNSVSGGTMSSITENANQNLTQDVQFIIQADENDSNKMYLYMYYAKDCVEENKGKEITTYLQVLTKNYEGVWFGDGTYIGRAIVDEYYGGGKNGKFVLTIGPYTWEYGAVGISEE